MVYPTLSPDFLVSPTQRGLLPLSPNLLNISSSKASRRPANIPLRTLSTHAENSDSAALLGTSANEKQARRSSLSRSSSPGSDFSWSDTGDLALQLDAEDPLHSRLRASLEEEVFGSSRRAARHKKVRYQEPAEDEEEEKEYHRGLVNKEDISIPTPAPRYISRAEHLLAIIMSGGERQMHGLTGKPLV